MTSTAARKWGELEWSAGLHEHFSRHPAAAQRAATIVHGCRPVHEEIRIVQLEVPLALSAPAETLAATPFLPLDALLAQPPSEADDTDDASVRKAKLRELHDFQAGLRDENARAHVLDAQIRIERVAGLTDQRCLRVLSNLPADGRPAVRARADQDRPAAEREVPAWSDVALASVQTAETQPTRFVAMPRRNVRGLMSIGGTEKRVLSHAALLLPARPADEPPASLAAAAWVAVPVNHVLRTMCEVGGGGPGGETAPPKALLATIAADDTNAVLAVYPAAHVAARLAHAESFLHSFLPDPLVRAESGFVLGLLDATTLAPRAWADEPPGTCLQLQGTLLLKVMLAPSATQAHLYPTLPLREGQRQ